MVSPSTDLSTRLARLREMVNPVYGLTEDPRLMADLAALLAERDELWQQNADLDVERDTWEQEASKLNTYLVRVVQAAAAVRDWLRSEAGPLYELWEEGNLAHWSWIDGGAWTWEQTLWNIENTQTDLRTEPVPSTAVDVYRALYRALNALPAADRARWGL